MVLRDASASKNKIRTPVILESAITTTEKWYTFGLSALGIKYSKQIYIISLLVQITSPFCVVRSSIQRCITLLMLHPSIQMFSLRCNSYSNLLRMSKIWKKENVDTKKTKIIGAVEQYKIVGLGPSLCSWDYWFREWEKLEWDLKKSQILWERSEVTQVLSIHPYHLSLTGERDMIFT